MSIIIRLQNLPLEANSLDIRRFFQGLQIPDGGVHIVGGCDGDAFIAFASDEDARQAMERDKEAIKENRVRLFLSSRNEMQKVIDLARNQTLGIKSIENMNNSSNSSANYLNSALLPPIVNSSQNSLKANITSNRTLSRSPDRRPVISSRSMDRENRVRNRSRSPLRAERNGNSGNPINRMGSMHSGIMDSIRDSSLNNSYPSHDSSVRSRLSYSNAIPPNALQVAPSGGQWPSNEAFDRSGLSRPVMTASGDYDRELELFRDQRSVQTRRDVNLNERSYTVELRNLPFNVVVRDIIDFFNGLYVAEENVKILIDDRGLTTGGALIRFNNERDFETALNLDKPFLGDRKIDVQPLLDNLRPERNDQMLYTQPLQHSMDPNMNLDLNRQQSAGYDLVLYMKGLPYSNCTDRDVLKFFEPIRLNDIVIETDPKGKPTGNAFVEFENPNDYDLGFKRNLKHMGRRYIELLPTSKDDMIDARRVSLPPPVMNEPSKTFCVYITGLPETVANRDLTNYFSSAGAQPFAIHIMLRANGLNAGEAYVEFGTNGDQLCALRRDGDFMGNSRISIKPVPFEIMRDVIGNPPPIPMIDPSLRSLPPPVSSRPSRGGRHDDRMRPQHRRDRMDRRDRNGDPFEDSRCVVEATNIPYKSSIEDICVFFSDFGITEACIKRRYNEKGQPTADAQIAFHTPSDAVRAVRQMHKKFLIGRPVFLKHG